MFAEALHYCYVKIENYLETKEFAVNFLFVLTASKPLAHSLQVYVPQRLFCVIYFLKKHFCHFKKSFMAITGNVWGDDYIGLCK